MKQNLVKSFIFLNSKNIILSIVILVLAVISSSSISVLAATFQDNTQTNFNAGTYSGTSYNVGSAGVVQSNASQPQTYTSSVFNSGFSQTKWTGISWVSPRPYGKQYPDNQGSDTGYSTGNLDMTGNFGLWHFNESATGSYADSSGNSNTGTCATTCPTINTTTGVFANAATFSTTTTQYVNTKNTNSVKGLSTVTIAMHFQPSTVSGTKVLYEEAVGGANNPRISLRLVANKIRLQVRTTDAASSDTVLVIHPTAIVTSSWYNVVAVFDSVTDVHHIYLNGVDENASVATTAFPNTNPNVVPRIAQNVATNLKFSGSIDEVAIFNRTLSATEASDMYQRSARARFQVQSCVSTSCTTAANYRGPNNTSTTWFSEFDNLVSGPPDIDLTNIITPQRQYFSYRIEFRNWITATNTLTAIVNNVTITYQEPFTTSFNLRDTSDTSNLSGGCNLGTFSTSSLNSCSYRIKITTNAINGFTLYVQSSGNFTNGTNNFSNASAGSAGAGGTLISGSSIGTEAYGGIFNLNNITNGTISLASIFDAGSTNSVALNNNTLQVLATATGPNSPAITDLDNTILVTHNATISPVTKPGNYTQSITYTVVPNY